MAIAVVGGSEGKKEIPVGGKVSPEPHGHGGAVRSNGGEHEEGGSRRWVARPTARQPLAGAGT
jgi:hypothetical protein